MATVLIIEDNPTNLKLAMMLLETAGHEPVGAPDAETGLALARATKPGLILMDIQLPGMDGFAAAAALKADAATRAIPLVALTALAMRGDEQRIMAAGYNGYIAKPLDYRTFLAVVAAHAPSPPSPART